MLLCSGADRVLIRRRRKYWLSRKFLPFRELEVDADVQLVFRRKIIWRIFLNGKANDPQWRSATINFYTKLEIHQLEESPT
ncbi:hypothetical protein ISS22_11850 [candidate division KSB1 bacterium]|nr:hypothetical protein [candidate division KSB1 bacterium]